jgi:hypothetical protein
MHLIRYVIIFTRGLLTLIDEASTNFVDAVAQRFSSIKPSSLSAIILTYNTPFHCCEFKIIEADNVMIRCDHSNRILVFVT